MAKHQDKNFNYSIILEHFHSLVALRFSGGLKLSPPAFLLQVCLTLSLNLLCLRRQKHCF